MQLEFLQTAIVVDDKFEITVSLRLLPRSRNRTNLQNVDFKHVKLWYFSTRESAGQCSHSIWINPSVLHGWDETHLQFKFLVRLLCLVQNHVFVSLEDLNMTCIFYFTDFVRAVCDCENECSCSKSNCTAGEYWLCGNNTGCVQCPAGYLWV